MSIDVSEGFNGQTNSLAKFNFHGDMLDVVQRDGQVWVSLKRVCEALGLGYGSQTQTLKRQAWATVTNIVTVGEDGKHRAMMMLDLDTFPMWLGRIDSNKVGEHARPKLVLYQRECARVLRERFFPRSEGNILQLEASLGQVQAQLMELHAHYIQVQADNDQLKAQVSDHLLYRGGLIGPFLAMQHITIPVREIARLACVAMHDSSTKHYKSVRMKVEQELRTSIGFACGPSQSWANLPNTMVSAARGKILRMHAQAKKAADAVYRSAPQPTLFDMFDRVAS